MKRNAHLTTFVIGFITALLVLSPALDLKSIWLEYGSAEQKIKITVSTLAGVVVLIALVALSRPRYRLRRLRSRQNCKKAFRELCLWAQKVPIENRKRANYFRKRVKWFERILMVHLAQHNEDQMGGWVINCERYIARAKTFEVPPRPPKWKAE